jgi:hypothetical protein
MPSERWDGVELHPDRNASRKAHPGENRIHRGKALHARRSVRNADAVSKPRNMAPHRLPWMAGSPGAYPRKPDPEFAS